MLNESNLYDYIRNNTNSDDKFIKTSPRLGDRDLKFCDTEKFVTDMTDLSYNLCCTTNETLMKPFHIICFLVHPMLNPNYKTTTILLISTACPTLINFFFQFFNFKYQKKNLVKSVFMYLWLLQLITYSV